ncbi:MAG TPA: nuclear transport factor 2 family protein [Luteimonas sp.]|nr:nuclear transport factor 2 family protein [Luteimonas sp.]
MSTPPLRFTARAASWSRMALLACFVLVAAAGCRREPPEQALRRELSSLQAAIVERDAGKVAGFLSEDFVGTGRLDREGARRLALVHFMRNRNIGITIGPADVAVRGDHATVRCSVVLTGGSGGLLPESGSVREVTSGWRLAQGEWRMTSLAWTPE